MASVIGLRNDNLRGDREETFIKLFNKGGKTTVQ